MVCSTYAGGTVSVAPVDDRPGRIRCADTRDRYRDSSECRGRAWRGKKNRKCGRLIGASIAQPRSAGHFPRTSMTWGESEKPGRSYGPGRPIKTSATDRLPSTHQRQQRTTLCIAAELPHGQNRLRPGHLKTGWPPIQFAYACSISSEKRSELALNTGMSHTEM